MKYINKEKTEKIKLNKSNFFVVIDFDKTITARQSCDSWDASGSMLGRDFKEKSDYLCKKYGPIELDYTISFEEKRKAMEEWYYGNFKLYYEYNLTEQKLVESVNKSDIIFRAGAKNFLQSMYENNIPVIVLSAGIGNVIEQFLKENDCYHNNMYIISNFIPFDAYGNIKEYEGKLIHTLNKTMEGHVPDRFKEKLCGRPYRLLFGDFIEDKKMVPVEEWDKTISVRFFGQKRG